MRLTDEAIKRRKRPTQGQLLLWDDLVSGFGVRLTPTKTAFVVQWRESDNRKPRESLRPHWPALSVARAREMARVRLGEVVGTRGSAGGEALRVAIRRWYERQTEIGSWRLRYRAKVDSIIATYFEGLDNARVKLTAGAIKSHSIFTTRSCGALMRLVSVIGGCMTCVDICAAG